MKPKLLILPSWYISEKDRINGSFFQAQGRLVSNEFDVRVISIRLQGRPSIRKLFSSPELTLYDWRKYLWERRERICLPDEEVFNNPKLFLFKKSLIRNPLQGYCKKVISLWLEEVRKMILSGWRPNLMAVHSVFPAGVVAKNIKIEFGIPYVICEHAPFTIYKYEQTLRQEIKEAFESADVVLSLSYDKVRQLAMSEIDVEPNIIYNFVDEHEFKGIANAYTPKSKMELVTIGAASFYKDHKTLLRAVKLLNNDDIPFHLTLIGLDLYGGDKLDETNRMITELGLAEKISIIGKLGRSEIASKLPNFNVFLMTSIQEGFPVSVLEALASGLYVVATKHGGTEDLIDEKMGILTRIKDPKAIADALKKIYNGEIQFNPVAIRESVIGICGRKAFSQRLMNYYKTALANGNQSGVSSS